MALTGLTKEQVQPFFNYARARHLAYLNRAAGSPRPWSFDPILQQYRFTNVFRELDKTTAWFRKHVREPLRGKPEVLLATVLFRMLNRIEVGEAIFCQKSLLGLRGETSWDAYLRTGDIGMIKQAIVSYCVGGPYVTGAYIISTPPGKKKLDGALWIVDNFRQKSDWARRASFAFNEKTWSLQGTFEWLREFDYLGNFHSYEIVTDLRWTKLLDKASDIMTWANMGPGARRGLNRIHGRQKGGHGRGNWGTGIGGRQALAEMRELLEWSKKQSVWPQNNDKEWPLWEMREVEHTLCEFDKYERVRTGEGTPRGRFR